MTLLTRRMLSGVLAVALVSMGGCKAGAKDEPSGFLDNSAQTTKQDDFPFHQAWFAPDWNNPDRNSIVVARVDTRFAPINVARATSFGEAQKSIREWASQWVKIANAPPARR